MSAAGCGKLTFIDCTMDRYAYYRILDENLLASRDQLKLIHFVFQHNNDPKHTNKFVKDYLKENNIEFCTGNRNPRILIPLNIFGAIYEV